MRYILFLEHQVHGSQNMVARRPDLVCVRKTADNLALVDFSRPQGHKAYPAAHWSV